MEGLGVVGDGEPQRFRAVTTAASKEPAALVLGVTEAWKSACGTPRLRA